MTGRAIRREEPMKLLSSQCLIFLMAILPSAFTVADDWSQWRGPSRDGISQETSLLESWPEGGPDLAWKAEGLGGGFSSVAIAADRIYTLGDLDDGSYVIALQEVDGTPVWNTRIGAAGGHRKYPGPRSTPTLLGDRLFALNQHGDLVCLDAKRGKKIWSVNLVDDFDGKMMSGWKYSESPLVDGDRVVCTPGGRKGTLLAIDRATGKQLWRTSDWTDPAGYSSVVIATIHGKRQYVQLTGNSVAGIEPKTGRVLWRADRAGKTAVVATPVVAGDIVFTTSAYGVGCNAFRLTTSRGEWQAKEIYANKNISNHHGGVILIDGHVFGSSGGTFRCLDLGTGDLAFAGRSAGKGATVYADGHLYLRSEDGPVALIEATSEGLREKSRFDQPDRSNKRAWPHPVVVNGKLYLRDQDLLLCYDISRQ